MKNKEIIVKIQKLKKISPRSKWITLNRAFLLREIKPDISLEPVVISWKDYGQVAIRLFSPRLLEPAVVMLLILGVFLSSSLIVNAAFYSLPGDPLYRVKIALEKTQVAITPGDENKVELKIEFAKKRVEEFDKIVNQTNVSPEQKKKNINTVVEEFKRNVVAGKDHIGKIQGQAPAVEKEKTLKMAISISSQTDELAQALDEKAESLSEVEKTEIKAVMAEAVASAQKASLSAQEFLEGARSQVEAEGVVEGESVEEVDQSGNSEAIIQESADSTSTVEIQVTTGSESITDSQGDSVEALPPPNQEQDAASETTKDIIE